MDDMDTTWTNVDTTVHVKPHGPQPRVAHYDQGAPGRLHLELHASGYGDGSHSRVVLYGHPEDVRALLADALETVEQTLDAEGVAA